MPYIPPGGFAPGRARPPDIPEHHLPDTKDDDQEDKEDDTQYQEDQINTNTDKSFRIWLVVMFLVFYIFLVFRYE